MTRQKMRKGDREERGGRSENDLITPFFFVGGACRDRFKDPSLSETEIRASWSKKQYSSSQAGPSRTCALFFSFFFLFSFLFHVFMS